MSEPAASPEPAASRPDSTRTGPGRLLVAVYALFALAASARAGVQIATKFGHAPVAYSLSAFAAVVYILATVTLAVGSPTARRIAILSCSVELVGVLAVGTWSVADPATFPDATVWSGYGSGYGFVPLVLPVSACSGYAAGPHGPEPGGRSCRQRGMQANPFSPSPSRIAVRRGAARRANA